MKLQSLFIALAAIGVNGLPQNKRSATLPDLTFPSVSLPTGPLFPPPSEPLGKRSAPLLPVTQTFPTKPMPTTPPNDKRAQGPNPDGDLLGKIGNLIDALCPSKWFVKPGDTCQSIAQTAGITVAQLIKLNPLYLTDCAALQNLKFLCLKPYNLPIPFPLPPPSKRNNNNNDAPASRSHEVARPPLSAVSPPASPSSSSSSTPLRSIPPYTPPTATATGVQPTGGAANGGLSGRGIWRNATVAAETGSAAKSGMAKRTGTGFF
ncbi:hypothetical protein FQN51_003820 [Onygenales sp. PD_10]|nr:hypothetical protein FQN51_003820 [Onygenales sp. PD_10]